MAELIAKIVRASNPINPAPGAGGDASADSGLYYSNSSTLVSQKRGSEPARKNVLEGPSLDQAHSGDAGDQQLEAYHAMCMYGAAVQTSEEGNHGSESHASKRGTTDVV